MAGRHSGELGERWPHREEIVWQSFERHLTCAMPAPDQFVRLNKITMLAAISSTDPWSGQVRCAQVFRETLAFFLGRNQESDLSMSRVSEMRADTLMSTRIDPFTSQPSPVVPKEPVPSSEPERWCPPPLS